MSNVQADPVDVINPYLKAANEVLKTAWGQWFNAPHISHYGEMVIATMTEVH